MRTKRGRVRLSRPVLGAGRSGAHRSHLGPLPWYSVS